MKRQTPLVVFASTFLKLISNFQIKIIYIIYPVGVSMEEYNSRCSVSAFSCGSVGDGHTGGGHEAVARQEERGAETVDRHGDPRRVQPRTVRKRENGGSCSAVIYGGQEIST